MSGDGMGNPAGVQTMTLELEIENDKVKKFEYEGFPDCFDSEEFTKIFTQDGRRAGKSTIKKLTEENERLKKENDLLKGRVKHLEDLVEYGKGF